MTTTEITDEDRIAALRSEKRRLEQELELLRKQRPALRRAGAAVTDTRVVTFRLLRPDRVLTDEEIARGFSRIQDEQAAEGFELKHTLKSPLKSSILLVFERSTRAPRLSFNTDEVLVELRKIRDNPPAEQPSMAQRLMINRLPAEYRQWVAHACAAVDPRSPSGHLLNAEEVAWIAVTAAATTAPPKKLVEAWRAAEARKRESGDALSVCYSVELVNEALHDWLTQLVGEE